MASNEGQWKIFLSTDAAVRRTYVLHGLSRGYVNLSDEKLNQLSDLTSAADRFNTTQLFYHLDHTFRRAVETQRVLAFFAAGSNSDDKSQPAALLFHTGLLSKQAKDLYVLLSASEERDGHEVWDFETVTDSNILNDKNKMKQFNLTPLAEARHPEPPQYYNDASRSVFDAKLPIQPLSVAHLIQRYKDMGSTNALQAFLKHLPKNIYNGFAQILPPAEKKKLSAEKLEDDDLGSLIARATEFLQPKFENALQYTLKRLRLNPRMAVPHFYRDLQCHGHLQLLLPLNLTQPSSIEADSALSLRFDSDASKPTSQYTPQVFLSLLHGRRTARLIQRIDQDWLLTKAEEDDSKNIEDDFLEGFDEEKDDDDDNKGREENQNWDDCNHLHTYILREGSLTEEDVKEIVENSFVSLVNNPRCEAKLDKPERGFTCLVTFDSWKDSLDVQTAKQRAINDRGRRMDSRLIVPRSDDPQTELQFCLSFGRPLASRSRRGRGRGRGMFRGSFFRGSHFDNNFRNAPTPYRGSSQPYHSSSSYRGSTYRGSSSPYRGSYRGSYPTRGSAPYRGSSYSDRGNSYSDRGGSYSGRGSAPYRGGRGGYRGGSTYHGDADHRNYRDD